MLRASTSLTFACTLVACADPNTGGTTSEATSGSSTIDTSKDGSSTTDVTSGVAPTTTGGTSHADTSGSTSPADTSGSTSPDDTTGSTSHADTSGSTSDDDTGGSTSTTSTEGSTTQDPSETDGEIPLKVGIALKSLCAPNATSVCGVTPDDKMVCWGAVDDPSYQVPPGKVKAVSSSCFMAVLENGELHRLVNFQAEPLSLPKGPFVLAAGKYPYGCAMAANNEMTCWVAEGYQTIEQPPPGPYLSLVDTREDNCQMCGIRGDGSLVCWKRPVEGNWYEWCNGVGWTGTAPGKYTEFIRSTSQSVVAMNTMGQLIWYTPGGGGSIYVDPPFASGGFVEAWALVGLKQSGELLYFEKSMGDGVPVIPGTYTTFIGDKNAGCAIRQADSRVVCWGQGNYGQFDPPTD